MGRPLTLTTRQVRAVVAFIGLQSVFDTTTDRYLFTAEDFKRMVDHCDTVGVKAYVTRESVERAHQELAISTSRSGVLKIGCWCSGSAAGSKDCRHAWEP